MDVLAETVKEALDKLMQNQNLVPLALLAALTIYLLWASRRKLRQSSSPSSCPAPKRELAPANPAVRDDVRRNIESLMLELEQLSRKIGADIDTRFVKLEAAMHDADRRIAALHRLTQRPGDAPVRPLTPETPGTVSDRPEDRYALIYELADVGFSPVEIARDLGRTPGEVELILNLRNKGQSRASGPKA
jgi:hypothetical protein